MQLVDQGQQTNVLATTTISHFLSIYIFFYRYGYHSGSLWRQNRDGFVDCCCCESCGEQKEQRREQRRRVPLVCIQASHCCCGYHPIWLWRIRTGGGVGAVPHDGWKSHSARVVVCCGRQKRIHMLLTRGMVSIHYCCFFYHPTHSSASLTLQ